MSDSLELLSLLADGAAHTPGALKSSLDIDVKELSNLRFELEQLGVDCVETEHGWRWTNPVELLDTARITNELGFKARSLVNSLEMFGGIDSTNRFLMDAARDGAQGGHACVAEFQSRGQGRRGRDFVSPIGNIYLSVLWRFDQDPAFLSGLSVAIGVAVAETCQRLGVSRVGVKWPNDVFWQGRKLSGILVETLMEAEKGTAVVVGVGLNFWMSDKAGASIGQSWTDIRSASAQLPNRNTAVAFLLESVVLSLEQFSQDGFKPFTERWNRHDVMRHRAVVLKGNGADTQGTAVGVDETGALLLDVDGVIKPVTTGDVSLRPRE